MRKPTIVSIILDIDQTIYKCEALSDAYNNAMISFIALKTMTDKQCAKIIFESNKEALKSKNGYSSSTEVLLQLGFSVDEWVKYSCDQVNPKRYLKSDERVKIIVQWLRSNFKIGILSNNNRVQVTRTLEAVGILDILSDVVVLSLSETNLLKPNLQLFAMMIEQLKSKPDQILVIGDRDDVDLYPARSLGMCTYLVNKMEDFYNLDSFIKTQFRIKD